MPRYKDAELFEQWMRRFGQIIDDIPDADVEEGKRVAWISVRDRLPEDVRSYLVCTDEGTMCVATFTGARWYISYNGNYVRDGEVTHWMPLPEPPEVEE